jgi:Ig-like domain-containing protein
MLLLIRPKITQQPQSLTVAVEQRASLSVAADGTRPLAYRWVKNSTTYLPFEPEKPSLVFDSVVFTNAGRYRVAITNAGVRKHRRASRRGPAADEPGGAT